MNTYTVTKTDPNGNAEEEIVTATSMKVDMGCLQFIGPTPGDGLGDLTTIKAYGIGGWINAEIKYP